MKFDWTIINETPITNEYHVCDWGFVVKIGVEGWNAVARIHGQKNPTTGLLETKEFQVGECYKTSASARSAVRRFVEKYKPLERVK
jgi:hypothetical protein